MEANIQPKRAFKSAADGGLARSNFCSASSEDVGSRQSDPAPLGAALAGKAGAALEVRRSSEIKDGKFWQQV